MFNKIQLHLISCVVSIIFCLSSCGINFNLSAKENITPASVAYLKTSQPTLTPSPPPTSTFISTPTKTPTPTPLPRDYLVKEGDTLSKIASTYQIPIASIILNNFFDDPNLIFPGQYLQIPLENETPSRIIKEGKQIVVILSQQTAYAFEEGLLQKEFIVSTGLPNTPTVLGNYVIQTKYDSTRMIGPGYDLPNVPWTMYFYQGYSFHGTYWHSNFGQPMSHGCINMKTEEAKWLYDWAPIGTKVLILP